MKKLTFLAIDGCLFSSINNLIDAFGIANQWQRTLNETVTAPLFETEIVSVDGEAVCANGNVCIQPDRSMAEVEATDTIFIPAFSEMAHLSAPDIDAVLSWIDNRYRRRIPIVATCTGAFLLAETGLLNGRIATTNWQFGRLFKRRYPQVDLHIDRMITEADGLTCTGAVTAIFNLALHLIQRYGSDELSSVCAKSLLVDPNRQSQAPYRIFRSNRNHGDSQILKAQQWMEENYRRAVTIDAVADRVGISPRHFKRRFRKATGFSPLLYLQSIRIQAAKEKLETTQESVNEITNNIGYEDSSTFRRLFKREVGLSPREYRNKFCRYPVIAGQR